MVTPTEEQEYTKYKKYIHDADKFASFIKEGIKKSDIGFVIVKIGDVKKELGREKFKDKTIYNILRFLLFVRHDLIVEMVKLKDGDTGLKVREIDECVPLPPSLEHLLKTEEE